MLQLNMKQGKERYEPLNSVLLFKLGFLLIFRTLTRILSRWLHVARISSLVFIIWGVALSDVCLSDLVEQFSLENTNENIINCIVSFSLIKMYRLLFRKVRILLFER